MYFIELAGLPVAITAVAAMWSNTYRAKYLLIGAAVLVLAGIVDACTFAYPVHSTCRWGRDNNTQTGGILMKVLGSVLALLLLIGVFFVLGYVGFTNSCNAFENQIQAQWDQNKNVYDNGWKKVQEVAQVPAMYVAHVKEVVTASIQGRYGTGGAKAVFLALKESNPNLDPSLYQKIQTVVEEFHNQFEQNQTRLISIKQEYANLRTATLSGRLYNTVAGYPRIDMSKFAIVTSDKTETDFDNHKAGVLKIGQ